MKIRLEIRTLFFVIINCLTINSAYGMCSKNVNDVSFIANNLSYQSDISDFNRQSRGVPLKIITLTSTRATDRNDGTTFQLFCDSNANRTYFFWAQGNLVGGAGHLLNPIGTFRPADGDWYGYKLNEYVAVGVYANISRFEQYFTISCLLNTNIQRASCPDTNGFRGVHPLGLVIHLYKIKDLPANSSGFAINRSYSVTYGVQPNPDNYPFGVSTGNVAVNIAVSGSVTTPDINVNDSQPVHFGGVVGDEVQKEISIKVTSNNSSTLSSSDYSISVTTPNRRDERRGLIGPIEFSLLSNSNPLRVDGDTSELWWPDLPQNSEVEIPLKLKFDIAGDPGQYNSYITFETSIP
ncbi:hypothetical protein [Vibrio brasiliensis]|uniref:Uncharacterized protein n=1 Tax=Vibrio brasiliensis LMG 20546 TaxID=945543 RepID=E8LVE4_9VIBR|nr:hypothetical protein [Vibrio brasiliensis]EGA65529.1 hypothetical protein VIBR0546_14625 [Vibrio brasiliensis LMG 20546]